MTRRIVAIALIFLGTSAAWMVLGATVFARTYRIEPALRGRVASTWGAPHAQSPPTASEVVSTTRGSESVENGVRVVRKVEERTSRALPLESTRARVSLALEPRRKGLLWYDTYRVSFDGVYSFRNPSERDAVVTFSFPYPAAHAVYDDLILSVDGVALDTTQEKSCATGTARIPARGTAALRVAYRSAGLDSWRYRFGGEVASVRDFSLEASTDFSGVDFPDGTLSPTALQPTPTGMEIRWSYRNLVTGCEIAIEVPQPLQPGPLAGRISFFAPVSLLFFFFLLFVITTLRRIELHPMNYFFLAAAFFAFHLLFAYLVDRVPVLIAFAASSVVSVFLVVSYLRLVVGLRFAAVEAGLSQVVYLVLFSYAFFLEGFTGLAVTIGATVTLFVVMQMTGRIRWAERFGAAG